MGNWMGRKKGKLVLKSRVIRTIRYGAIAAACTVLAGQASAKEPDLGQEVIHYPAPNQDIRELLEGVFEMVGASVQIAPNVQSVETNGTFDGPAQSVLTQILDSAGLIAYDDGLTTFIYTGDDIRNMRKAMDKSRANKVHAQADALGLIDKNNGIKVGPGNQITVRGVPRFISDVEALIESTPRLRSAAKGKGKTKKSPDGEISWRVFHLVHAQAEDRTVGSAYGNRDVRGVASLLQELVSEFYGEEELKAASIVASPSQNAVIVRDRADRLDEYEELIRLLDVERQQIQIDVQSIDINVDKAREIGVNFRVSDLLGENSILFGSGTASDLSLRPGQLITPSQRGGAVNFRIGDDDFIAARITALESKGIVNIVNRTELLAQDNETSVFTDTEEFVVPLIGERVADTERIEAGTKIYITPTVQSVGGERIIQALVDIEIGSLVASGTGIPIKRTATMSNHPKVRPGQTVVMTGFISQSEGEVTDKVPLLGDVPVVGRAFRSTFRQQGEVQKVFLITPRFVDLDEVADTHPILLQPQFDGASTYTPLTETLPFTEERVIFLPGLDYEDADGKLIERVDNGHLVKVNNVAEILNYVPPSQVETPKPLRKVTRVFVDENGNPAGRLTSFVSSEKE